MNELKPLSIKDIGSLRRKFMADRVEAKCLLEVRIQSFLECLRSMSMNNPTMSFQARAHLSHIFEPIRQNVYKR